MIFLKLKVVHIQAEVFSPSVLWREVSQTLLVGTQPSKFVFYHHSVQRQDIQIDSAGPVWVALSLSV
jgi:hypothetical protein